MGKGGGATSGGGPIAERREKERERGRKERERGQKGNRPINAGPIHMLVYMHAYYISTRIDQHIKCM